MKYMKRNPRWETGRHTNITELIGALHDNTKAFHPFFTEDKISDYPAIVFCCYLQCLQIGYRQIITTLTTLHPITITHRHCVERGHYIIISHVSFRLEFCLKFIYTILWTPLNTVCFKFTNFSFRYTLSCSWNVCKLCVLFCSKYQQEFSLETVINAI